MTLADEARMAAHNLRTGGPIAPWGLAALLDRLRESLPPAPVSPPGFVACAHCGSNVAGEHVHVCASQYESTTPDPVRAERVHADVEQACVKVSHRNGGA